MARKPKPFDKIMLVRGKLDMFMRYGEAALGKQTIGEFMADVHEAFENLMAFRNIINGMVGFNETPAEAVLPYLPESDDGN